MGLSTKKRAAITSAVVTYIKTQEEAAYAAQAGGAAGTEPAPVQAAPAALPAMNAWGMAGRTDQMQGRSLMQLRVFR